MADDPDEHESGAPGPTVDDRLARIHEALAATAERPVEPAAARWLGEAEAVAADVADGDAPPEAVDTRLDQLRELLSHVEETGDEAADASLAAARDHLEALEVPW